MSARTAWQVTLHVNVNDSGALWAAAQAHCIQSGMTQDDTHEILGDQSKPDIGNCLRMLLDPGTSPEGCEIVDSGAEGGDELG